MVSPEDMIVSDPNHIYGTSLLEKLGLRIHKAYRILICINCGIAWLPSSIKTHLAGHGIKFNSEQESELNKTIADCGVSQTHNVPVPKPGGPPVEHLKLQPDGHCCKYCTYCTPTKTTFLKHWSMVHKDLGYLPENSRFTLATIQTFFSPVAVKYFKVNPDLIEHSQKDLFTIYMENEVPNFLPFSAHLPDHERDTPPFLQMTQWHIHLQDFVTEYKKRQSLKELVNLPKRVGSNPTGVDFLPKLCFAYLDEVRNLAKKTHITALCMLEEYPMSVNLQLSIFFSSINDHNSRTKQDQRYWKVLGDNNTLSRYSQQLHALTRSILLTVDGHISGYSFPLTDSMITNAHALLDGLEEEPDLTSLLPKLHTLIYPCFCPQQRVNIYSKWNDVLECFMAIHALKEDGNFENGANLTQFFAILKYLCRCTMLFQSVQERDNFDDDPVR
jgi:Orsellinic acid/F9775 biosynthesis cluster protein D